MCFHEKFQEKTTYAKSGIFPLLGKKIPTTGFEPSTFWVDGSTPNHSATFFYTVSSFLPVWRAVDSDEKGIEIPTPTPPEFFENWGTPTKIGPKNRKNFA